MSHKRIHPIDLMANNTANVCILDVRTNAETKAVALPNCLHIPLHELTAERLQAEIEKNGKDSRVIYLLCQAGRRAEMAADQLAGKLNAEFVVIDGGMNALKQSNIPLIAAAPNAISLERQVRIADGLLVLTGVILGTWFNPLFYALSGFVGAGLVVAGIADICLMGMLIAKAPWNK